MSNQYWYNLKPTTSKQGRLFNVESILKLLQFNNIETWSIYQCRINIEITSNQQHWNKIEFQCRIIIKLIQFNNVETRSILRCRSIVEMNLTCRSLNQGQVLISNQSRINIDASMLLRHWYINIDLTSISGRHFLC